MKKKIFALLLLVVCCVGLLTGCGDVELKMSQEEIINTLYDGVDMDNDLPKVDNIPITEDNIESFLGKKYDFVEGIASEPLMGSIAHSIVVVRLSDDTDMEKVEEEIEKAAEETLYRKWICVEADEVEVDTIGHTVILIMTNEKVADKIEDNVNKLK